MSAMSPIRGFIALADYQRLEAERDALAEEVARLKRDLPAPAANIGALAFDFAVKSVRVGGKPVHLTATEWELLALLAQRPGRLFTNDAIMDALYGGRDEPCLKIIQVYVCKIRRKLGAAGGQIETVWSRGLRLVETPVPHHVLSWRQKVLEALQAEPLSPRAIAGIVDGRYEQVHGAIQRLMAEGLVANIGTRRSGLYGLVIHEAAA